MRIEFGRLVTDKEVVQAEEAFEEDGGWDRRLETSGFEVAEDDLGEVLDVDGELETYDRVIQGICREGGVREGVEDLGDLVELLGESKTLDWEVEAFANAFECVF